MLPKAKSDDLVVQESGKDLLIYDVSENRAICLNKTCVLIWEKCDGTRSPLDIQKELQEQIGVEIKEDLVWFGLEQLDREGLLLGDDRISEVHNSISRREMIRRIGLTSAIALPIVSSLVAPSAALAQSVCVPPNPNPACLPNGNVGCMSDFDCCSCNCMVSNGNCVMS